MRTVQKSKVLDISGRVLGSLGGWGVGGSPPGRVMGPNCEKNKKASQKIREAIEHGNYCDIIKSKVYRNQW